ncbi:unnamed protein product [Ilex paraguariensis]|uniref:Acidic protein n=1 Tax=Ilex paraguariensis TaxID=185542 RepID=A0ABC8T749_9AQUA
MKLQLGIALLCIICLIWTQEILCDEPFTTSSTNKWTCTCSSAYQGNQSFAISTNCSSSCDCSLAAGGSNGNKWICICAADGFPKLAADSNDTNCFTTCNCNSGMAAHRVQWGQLISLAVGTVAEIETLISRVNFVKQIGRFIMKSIHEWTSSFL